MPAKPWLLLDIDGVLNVHMPPKQARALGYLTHTVTVHLDAAEALLYGHGDGSTPVPLTVPLAIRTDTHALLARLGERFDIAWCTTWGRHAPAHIAPLVGLDPALPIVDLAGAQRPHPQLCWKTGRVIKWIETHPRPFVWLDDEVTRRDRKWIAGRGDLPPGLPVHVDSSRGVRDTDEQRATAWLETLTLHP